MAWVPHASAQLRGEIPALGHLDPVEFEPRLHLPELAGQVWYHAARVLPQLEERALHHQDLRWRSAFRSQRATSVSPSRNGNK